MNTIHASSSSQIHETQSSESRIMRFLREKCAIIGSLFQRLSLCWHRPEPVDDLQFIWNRMKKRQIERIATDFSGASINREIEDKAPLLLTRAVTKLKVERSGPAQHEGPSDSLQQAIVKFPELVFRLIYDRVPVFGDPQAEVDIEIHQRTEKTILSLSKAFRHPHFTHSRDQVTYTLIADEEDALLEDNRLIILTPDTKRDRDKITVKATDQHGHTLVLKVNLIVGDHAEKRPVIYPKESLEYKVKRVEKHVYRISRFAPPFSGKTLLELIKDGQLSAETALESLKENASKIGELEKFLGKIESQMSSRMEMIKYLPTYWKVFKAVIVRDANYFKRAVDDQRKILEEHCTDIPSSEKESFLMVQEVIQDHYEQLYPNLAKKLAQDIMYEIYLEDPKLKESNPTVYRTVEELLPKLIQWLLSPENKLEDNHDAEMVTYLVANIKPIAMAALRLSSSDPEFRGGLTKLIHSIPSILESNVVNLEAIISPPIKNVFNRLFEQNSPSEVVDTVLECVHKHVKSCQVSEKDLEERERFVTKLNHQYEKAIALGKEVSKGHSGHLTTREDNAVQLVHQLESFDGSGEMFVDHLVCEDLLELMFDRLPKLRSDWNSVFAVWMRRYFENNEKLLDLDNHENREALVKEMKEKIHSFFQSPPFSLNVAEGDKEVPPIEAWRASGVDVRDLFYQSVKAAFYRQHLENMVVPGKSFDLVRLPKGKLMNLVEEEINHKIGKKLFKTAFPDGVETLLNAVTLPKEQLSQLLFAVFQEAKISSYAQENLYSMITRGVKAVILDQLRSQITKAIEDALSKGLKVVTDQREFLSIFANILIPTMHDQFFVAFANYRMGKERHHFLKRSVECKVAHPSRKEGLLEKVSKEIHQLVTQDNDAYNEDVTTILKLLKPSETNTKAQELGISAPSETSLGWLDRFFNSNVKELLKQYSKRMAPIFSKSIKRAEDGGLIVNEDQLKKGISDYLYRKMCKHRFNLSKRTISKLQFYQWIEPKVIDPFVSKVVGRVNNYLEQGMREVDDAIEVSLEIAFDTGYIPFMGELISDLVEIGELDASIARMVVTKWREKIADGVTGALADVRGSFDTILNSVFSALLPMLDPERIEKMLTANETKDVKEEPTLESQAARIEKVTVPRIRTLLEDVLEDLPVGIGFVAKRLLPENRDLTNTILNIFNRTVLMEDRRKLLLYSILTTLERKKVFG